MRSTHRKSGGDSFQESGKAQWHLLRELTVDCWQLTVRKDHQLWLSTVNRQLSTCRLNKRYCR
jgi:hypothetical protein